MGMKNKLKALENASAEKEFKMISQLTGEKGKREGKV